MFLAHRRACSWAQCRDPAVANVPILGPVFLLAAGFAHAATPATPQPRGEPRYVQVNVDSAGENIPGDAANEPSLAVDRNNPNRIAIGWRQFDTIDSYPEAGWGFSRDAGRSWTAGVLEDGVFRSDPVLTSVVPQKYLRIGWGRHPACRS